MYQLSKTYKLQNKLFTETTLMRQVLDGGCVFLVDDSAKEQLRSSDLLMLRNKNIECEEI